MKISLNLNVLDKWIPLIITHMAYYTCIEGREAQRDNSLVLYFNSTEERDIAYNTIEAAIIERKFCAPDAIISRTLTKATESQYDMEWQKKLIIYMQNGQAGIMGESSFKIIE